MRWKRGCVESFREIFFFLNIRKRSMRIEVRFRFFDMMVGVVVVIVESLGGKRILEELVLGLFIFGFDMKIEGFLFFG